MNESVTNEQVIQAVFTATDEAKEHALEILEGRAGSPNLPQDNDPLLLRMGEAAEMLNVSRATLWRTIKAGSLEKVELYPGSFRLRRSDIIALVNNRTAGTR
ncbi:helix-turn-helix transcriptional regulator [Tichowtungia aerotolerans]|uniref:Helix-turn-helix domain-containing protein n=1 Tax=Tichowtungia aerotolerans TaxID=2697043 RepID=A0A6P1MGE9_9BACT|nr:helix-turn-helix domain-containing protein [Tichowtungia aerotolerans]QHI70165.1 helix-turn-helix domain-containing protein [Tichowtungia aerotolerans]